MIARRGTREEAVPIYQTAHYQVKASAVDKVKAAIAEFVEYVAKNEPGSRMYTAWQQKGDPTRFVHLFEFADEAAHQAHVRSVAVKPQSAFFEALGADGVQALENVCAYSRAAGLQVAENPTGAPSTASSPPPAATATL